MGPRARVEGQPSSRPGLRRRGKKLGWYWQLSSHTRCLIWSTVVAVITVAVVAAVAIGVQSRVPTPYKPWLRPIAHALPEKNWCNDPNAPMFYGGKYHLFMQYNPGAAKWGNIHWYHITRYVAGRIPPFPWLNTRTF